MILDSLNNTEKVECLHPLFKKAFDYHFWHLYQFPWYLYGCLSVAETDFSFLLPCRLQRHKWWWKLWSLCQEEINCSMMFLETSVHYGARCNIWRFRTRIFMNTSASTGGGPRRDSSQCRSFLFFSSAILERRKSWKQTTENNTNTSGLKVLIVGCHILLQKKQFILICSGSWTSLYDIRHHFIFEYPFILFLSSYN